MIANILDAVNSQKAKMENFLKALVGFPSVSGNEIELQKWLKDELESWRVFDIVDFWYVDKEHHRPDVVAVIRAKTRKNQKKRALIFNGHVDVVPVPDRELERWATDPWKAVIKDGRLYGRGASDMKGGDVAMLWAAKILGEKAKSPDKDLIIQLVVGEEEGQALGTRAAFDHGYTGSFAIFPEPSDLDIKVAIVGAFGMHLFVEGKEIHTGLRNRILYPHPYGVPTGDEVGVDAIEKMNKIVASLKELERHWALKWNHKRFTPETTGLGSSLINIGIIRGGESIFVVPGSCEIAAEVTYSPSRSVKQVIEEIQRQINNVSRGDDWLSKHRPKLIAPYLCNAPGHEVSTSSAGCVALAKAIKEANGAEPKYSAFQTWGDWNFTARHGVKSVCYGPDFSGAHGPNESVSLTKVLKVSRAFGMMASNWCGFR